MDFSFTEEQDAVRELAAQILGDQATTDRVKAVEATDDRVDWDLWSGLADAGLLGIALPTEHGGSGLGLIELALLWEQQGRVVAPVPLWATLALGARPLATFGSPDQARTWLPRVISGEAVLTAALGEPGENDPFHPGVVARPDGDGWRLSGAKPSVPAGHLAERVLVPARTTDGVTVFLVDPAASGVSRERVEITSRQIHAEITFDEVALGAADVVGEPGGGEQVIASMFGEAVVGLSALTLGVGASALEQAAAYTSQREQFGRPLSTNQGVALRAADAYIDLEAIRGTLWQAAWCLDAGRPAVEEVSVARWWAAEGGHRVVHATQHLHGGIGADVDYPIHRHFLWGQYLAGELGGASWHLARLGREIAARAREAVS